MIDSNVLLSVLLARSSCIKGIDKDVLQSFLKQTNLTLRSEHFNFLLNYGCSSDILTSMFADCTFERFKEIYLNKEEDLDGDLPVNSIYFGHDFSDESLCIENKTGHIYMIMKSFGYYIIKTSPAFYYMLFYLIEKKAKFSTLLL